MEDSIKEVQSFVDLLSKSVLKDVDYSIDLYNSSIILNLQYTAYNELLHTAATSDIRAVPISKSAMEEAVTLYNNLRSISQWTNLQKLIAEHSNITATFVSKSFKDDINNVRFYINNNNEPMPHMMQDKNEFDIMLKNTLRSFIPETVDQIRLLYQAGTTDPLNTSPAITGRIEYNSIKYSTIQLVAANEFPRFIDLLETLYTKVQDIKQQAELRLRKTRPLIYR